MSENTGNSINKSPVFGNRLEQLVLKGANCLHTTVVPKFSALEAKKKPVFMSNSTRLQDECLGLKYFLHHQCLFVLFFHLNRYLFGLRWLHVMVSI